MIDWDALERKAAAYESQAEATAAAPLPGEPEPISEEAELSMLLTMVRNLIAVPLPYVDGIYTDEVISVIADRTVPVFRKHGIQLSGIAGSYAEELALLLVLAPLSIATYQAHKEWKLSQLPKPQTPTPPAPNKMQHQLRPPAPPTWPESLGSSVPAAQVNHAG